MDSRNCVRPCETRHRTFILSDISNEPDDAESLCRYLLYSNEFDTRGIIATTSTHMKSTVHPDDMRHIVNAYGQVVERLNAHVHPRNPYPTEDSLLDLIASGPAVYGKAALESGAPISDGAKMLVARLDESDLPLWVLVWGGTNVLAEALKHVHDQRDADKCAHLRSKLRVYAISDQDDTGQLVRSRYPDLFYIVSLHGWCQYGASTWCGISGDSFDNGGPDPSQVSPEWLKKHIQIGSFGKVYPTPKFLMEGDTPTFLYLIQNGLSSPENPEWGSWGGRYTSLDLDFARKTFSDATDVVIGHDGKKYCSNQATIWRWRNAFQNDFAARMQWTLTSDFSAVNHAPVAIVNESTGSPEPLIIRREAGTDLILDASKSYDPDGDDISFRWFHYTEASPLHDVVYAPVERVPFEDLSPETPGAHVKVTLPSPRRSAVDLLSGRAQAVGQQLHFILEVKDNGSPNMVSYKRVVVQIQNANLKGGWDHGFETVADALDALHDEEENSDRIIVE
jgi:hypothetical protein